MGFQAVEVTICARPALKMNRPGKLVSKIWSKIVSKRFTIEPVELVVACELVRRGT
jgi:hypothetical protein